MRAVTLFALLTTALFAADPVVIDGSWTNQASGRIIAYRARIPAEAGKRPTVLISHGLGGSMDGMEYLGTYWAAHGYLVIHLQHPGSDSSILKGMLLDRENTLKAATSAEEFKARIQDAKVALDKLRTTPGISEHYDAGEVAICGHSYGARTSLALSGERYPTAPGIDFSDPRIRAAIVLSPPPYSGAERFSSIGIPQFHWTGTADTTPLEESKDPALRMCPWRESSTPSSYLVVLDKADHMTFSGRLPLMDKDQRKNYVHWHAILAEATTRFLDATLQANKEAKGWLDGEGLSKLLGPKDKLERRK